MLSHQPGPDAVAVDDTLVEVARMAGIDDARRWNEAVTDLIHRVWKDHLFAGLHSAPAIHDLIIAASEEADAWDRLQKAAADIQSTREKFFKAFEAFDEMLSPVRKQMPGQADACFVAPVSSLNAVPSLPYETRLLIRTKSGEWVRIDGKLSNLIAQIARCAEMTRDASKDSSNLFAGRASNLRRSKSPRLGRPNGTKHSLLLSFIADLLISVWDAGGELRFTKTDYEETTLAQALRLLSPHLPPKMVPNTLPITMITEICAHCRKKRRDQKKVGKVRPAH